MSIALLQKGKNFNGASMAPCVITLPGATTSGNLLVVAIGNFYNSGLGVSFSVSDNASNSWHQAVFYSGYGVVAVYYAYNITGRNSPTVTVTPSGNGAGNFAVEVAEFSGLTSSDPLDQTATANSNSSSASVGPTATTTAQTELLIGAFHFQQTYSPFTPGPSGFSLVDASQEGGGSEYCVMTWAGVSSTGGYSATCGSGNSGPWDAAIVTFRAVTLITGSGGATAAAATSGSGAETFSGTAAPHAMLAGTGSSTQTVSGSGGVQAAAATSGSGFKADNVGAGALALAAETQAAGTLSFSGSATPVAPCTVAASGTELFTSTGAVRATTAQTAASGTEVFSGAAHLVAIAAAAIRGVTMPPISLWPRAKW